MIIAKYEGVTGSVRDFMKRTVSGRREIIYGSRTGKWKMQW